jgi:(p)ppGpp synthase/HD superfamily hydrolase
MEAYSERYEAALALVIQAHRTQLRKGSGVPYATHPIHVSVILLRHGFSEDVAIAGLLHDVVEDQDVPLAGIEAAFGPAVAQMVAAVTEKKREGDVERPWMVRKQEQLDHLGQASLDAIALKAADTLHNVRSVASGLRRQGSSLWNDFKRGPGPSLWYYRSVAAIVCARLGAHPLADELKDAIQILQQEVGEAGANG